MTTSSLHPTPKLGIVLWEQIRAVGRALQKEGKFFLVLLGVMTLLGGAAAWKYRGGQFMQGPGGDCNYLPGMSARVTRTTKTESGQKTAGLHGAMTIQSDTNGIAMTGSTEGNGMDLLLLSLIPVGFAGMLLTFGLPGAVIPFGMWRSEDPSRRSYHWAMPVRRSTHTLIKVFAGWLWLMLVVAVYIAFFLTLAAIGYSVLNVHCNFQPTLDGLWVTSFTSATLIYLMLSTVVVSSRNAWRWIVGLTVIYILALSVAGIFHIHDLLLTLVHLLTGSYGLLTALFGGIGDTAAETKKWLGAVSLWGALSLIAVWIAAYRRRDS